MEEFYEKIFTSGTTEISRGDLEGLPCPFCTENVTDETMQKLADLTECSYQSRIDDDMDDDRKSEIWWEEMEDTANYLNIPYYEDID